MQLSTRLPDAADRVADAERSPKPKPHASATPPTVAMPSIPLSSPEQSAPRPSSTATPQDANEEDEEGMTHEPDDDERHPHDDPTAVPPELRRPSSLFDTVLATEALFARLHEQEVLQQQQQHHQQQPPPPLPPSIRPNATEPPVANRPSSVPISSILGRPPPAPSPHSGTASPTADGVSPAYPAHRREPSSSSSPVRPSSFRVPQRSASPTSTVDYVEIEHKQNELRYAVEHHIQSLEHALSRRDEELAALTMKLRKLEEDYQFNYNLIGERDAAIEEASTQLQRLFRELRRLTEEAARTHKKVEGAEAEVRAARQRVRDVEEERDTAVRHAQKEYAIKERHLLDTVRAKEAALEQDQREQHAWYKEQLKALEDERAAFADRSLSAVAESEDRYKQQLTRMQSELIGVQQTLRTARQDKADGERRISNLEEAQATLLREAAVAQHRHGAALQDAEEAKKELEERLARMVVTSEKRTTAAETATREEAARSSRLELERTRLQSMLAETQERLQHLTTQYEEDIVRYTKERQTLLKEHDNATVATTQVEQQLQDAQRELEKQRRLAAEENGRLTGEVERLRTAWEDTRRELAATKERCDQWEAQAAHLEAEVRRWKTEEDKTATSGRQERSAWEEKCRQAERQVSLLQEEMQQAKRQHQSDVEKAQSGALRLTRELHASEAARHTLEEQFHLQDDLAEEARTLHTLRTEKEQLQRRVVELERTNAEVRQQVAAFTAELQNDPVLKAAKESQQRVVELQHELAAAKAEQQLLQDTVKEKEDALVRCQTEMLRVQVLTGGDTASVSTATGAIGDGVPSDLTHRLLSGTESLSNTVSRALQRQQQQMRSEYSKMRESYEEMVRELDRQHRRRRQYRRVRKAAETASRSNSSSSSSSSRSSGAASTSRAGSLSKKITVRHAGRKSGSGESKTTAATLPPVLPDSKAAHLLQEAEVWRRQCAQLEQQLQLVLRERDRLGKELQLAKQDVAALGTEKQCLIDLNALLKTQLRDAYRMRVAADAGARFAGAAATATPTVPPSVLPQASTARDVRISPELLAAALQALEAEETYAGNPTATTQVTTSSSSGNTRTVPGAFTEHGAPRAAPHSTAKSIPGVRSTGDYGGASPMTAAGPTISAQTAQQRLAALEQEIEDVRGQIHAAQPSPSAVVPERQSQPVVRRGKAAVRHYGYSN